MVTQIKTFLRSLSEIPEGTFPPSHYTPISRRTIYFGNYAYFSSLVLMAIYVLVWSLLRLYFLALIFFLAVLVFIAVFTLHRRGYFLNAHFLTALLWITLNIFSVIMLGWEGGFQYFLILPSVTVFYAPWGVSIKGGLVGTYVATYFCMYFYSSSTNPFIALDPNYLKVLYQMNVMVVSGYLAFAIHINYRMAIKSDKKLFIAHQKTKIVLEERDRVLKQLNGELSEAAGYVRKILPQPVSEGSIRTDWRFVPSTSLGGDAFGYHRIDDENLAAYLIDVSGHGVGAALLSISVINVLRSQSLRKTDFKDPGQVLGSLNKAFPSESNKDMFFTMWYGVYNENSRELTYASGGHPPAILFKANPESDDGIQLLRTPNYVIGGMPEATYTTEKCFVGEGNTLYIYSDGVYEIEKTDGSMWRFQEFTDYMQKVRSEKHSVLDLLYSHVKSLGNTETLEDDFTILEVVFG